MEKTSRKFALIGTSCVGKTTMQAEIGSLLRKKLKQKKISLVPEAARLYFLSVTTQNRFSFYHQRRIQSLVKQLEEKEASADVIITDRSVFDAAAYTYAMGNSDGAQKLLYRMQKWLKTYTHMFLLDPNSVPYNTDDTRVEDAILRERFHQGFLSLLPQVGIPTTVVTGSKQKRLDNVMNIIYNSLQDAKAFPRLRF